MGYALNSTKTNNYHAAQLGNVLQLMAATGRSNLSIGALHTWLWPAIKLNQIEFIYANHRGAPVAYIIWAFLSDDVVKEMKSGSERLLDMSVVI